MATLGIEEEYLLLDPTSALPAWAGTEVSGHMAGAGRVASDDVQRELLSCQLETATPVCDTLAEAGASLLAFRKELAAAALKAGTRAAASGTAPRFEPGMPQLTDKRRYHQLKESAQEIVADQYVNGLHVHVGVPDREAGVQVLNRIRRWIPAVIALAANSPLWLDRDSGFASWRTINYRRWPVQGCPPDLRDANDYDRRVKRLLDIGAIIDTGVVTWVARLSENYPTIEVRAADVQLEVEDTLALAGIIRALVVTALNDHDAGRPYLNPDEELVDAAIWQAARHGLTGDLVRIKYGKLAPARSVVEVMLDHIGPALDEAGDSSAVVRGVGRFFEMGTGAERQRAAMDRGGLPALIDLYTKSLVSQ